MKTTGYMLAAIIGVLSLGVCAANSDTNSTPGTGNRPGGGSGGSGHKPPETPIVKALDANGDGVIDAKEIANASAALKKLDKNGDGKLTRDEYMPTHQKGQGGPGGKGGGSGSGSGSDQPPPPPNE